MRCPDDAPPAGRFLDRSTRRAVDWLRPWKNVQVSFQRLADS